MCKNKKSMKECEKIHDEIRRENKIKKVAVESIFPYNN
jgi:hypothetical protein